MKIFQKIIIWTLSVVNIDAVLAMCVCAYSYYINPAHYPNWSYLGMMLPICMAAVVVFIPLWLIVKWKYCAISILGMVICWGSIRDYCPINLTGGEPEGRSIKVLSYNVYSFGGKELSEDNMQVADYITASGADIVCIQEVGGIGRTYVREQLDAEYPYISIDDDKEPKNAILSRYPILSSQKIELESKSASSCIYEILIEGDTIAVINNHLESYHLDSDDKEIYTQMIKQSNPLKGKPTDEEEETVIDMKESFWWLEGKLAKANALRAGQADRIEEEVERLLERHKYVMVCGDFNDSPISYVHHKLTNQLHDAYTQSGNGPGWSYNRNAMYFRIDHILVSKSMESYAAKVDKSIKESDHYPIFCTLELH